MELGNLEATSESGHVSSDWEAAAIDDLCEIRTGPFGTLLSASEYSQSHGVPMISVGEIVGGKCELRADTPLIPDAVVQRLPQYVLRTGDIVFGRKGAVDRCALITDAEDGWFLGSDGIRLRPRTTVDPQYLLRQLQRRDVQCWLARTATGTTMASLNQEILRRIVVPVTAMAEQRAIATALGDVDALLGALDKLIAKKRDLKQAAMQQLLTGRTRLPGFAGEWRRITFGEVAAIRNVKVIAATTPLADRCVELDDVAQGSGRLLHVSTAAIGASKYSFKAGDVLFGRLRAYLRKYWHATFDGVCSTEIWPLMPLDLRLEAPYLYWLVQTDGFAKSAGITYGTHMPRTDWSVVSELEIRLPDPDEQRAIATILSDMDAEIAALEARRAKIRDLKQAMMQELLTGKTRLA